MKIAVLSESPADEAAIRILVGGILGRQTQMITLPSLRTRGLSGVFAFLPTVLKHLYYRTDAEALVTVVDSDDSPVHLDLHEQPSGADEKCRLCSLRQIIQQVQGGLSPVMGRPLIRTAVGLAVPAMEAWYQYGVDPHATEAAWIMGLQSEAYPYTTKSLKQAVYETDRPSLALETRRATEQAQRLVRDLGRLEQLFPGFQFLARGIRSW